MHAEFDAYHFAMACMAPWAEFSFHSFILYLIYIIFFVVAHSFALFVPEFWRRNNIKSDKWEME